MVISGKRHLRIIIGNLFTVIPLNQQTITHYTILTYVTIIIHETYENLLKSMIMQTKHLSMGSILSRIIFFVTDKFKIDLLYCSLIKKMYHTRIFLWTFENTSFDEISMSVNNNLYYVKNYKVILTTNRHLLDDLNVGKVTCW